MALAVVMKLCRIVGRFMDAWVFWLITGRFLGINHELSDVFVSCCFRLDCAAYAFSYRNHLFYSNFIVWILDFTEQKQMKPQDDSSLHTSSDDLQIQYAEIEPMVGYHVGKWLAYVALALLCVYLWVSYAAA